MQIQVNPSHWPSCTSSLSSRTPSCWATSWWRSCCNSRRHHLHCWLLTCWSKCSAETLQYSVENLSPCHATSPWPSSGSSSWTPAPGTPPLPGERSQLEEGRPLPRTLGGCRGSDGRQKSLCVRICGWPGGRKTPPARERLLNIGCTHNTCK